ncbi:MAG: ribosomal protein [Pseudomonadota bacterium]|jgi:small subunit ribosomal protein S17
MTVVNKTQKLIEGLVTSVKMDKTAVVKVSRKQRHPKFGGKTVSKSTKYYVHDEANACQEGDLVRFKECAPFSKTKAWTLVEILSSKVAQEA